MSLCAQCGSDAGYGVGICNYHVNAMDEQWAESNRIMCDFIHRKKEPVRVERQQREEESFYNG